MKQFILKTIVYLIFLVLINGLFFTLVDYHKCPDAMWAALIGINVGYLSLLLIPLLIPKSNDHRVLSGTLYSIGSFYFAFELIAGVIFLFWPTETISWPVGIQAVLLAIYLVVLLSSYQSNNATIHSVDEQREQSDAIFNRANDLRVILDLTPDGDCKRIINICYSEIKNAPLKSDPKVAGIEQEIDQLIMALNSYVAENNNERIKSTVGRIRMANTQRNNILKHLTNY